MLFLKVWYHFFSKIKVMLYYILFGNKVSFGKKATFRKNFTLAIENEGKVKIGERCFFNNGCSIMCMNKVSIGDGSLFGEGVKIYDHNHRFGRDNVPIKDQGFSVGEVSVGDHCWIGSNVVLLKGCKIGKNCVIGAGCVISGEVPDNTIVKKRSDYLYSKIQGTFQ